jgi:type IV secretion system protein VirD4
MEDHNDDLTAGATVTTFFDNVIAASDGKNAFFDNFAVFTLTALLMMAKHPDSSMPDLPMVWEYLALPSLGKRLVAAVQAGFFDESGFGPWAKRVLSGLLSTAGTRDTEAGITASAMNVLMPLLSRKFYPCLSYPFNSGSTIPLDLKGRQIVFFELDGLAMQQTSPLVATALNMLIRHNLNEHSNRDRPLGIILDEYARIVLPDFEQVVSLNRSYGFYAVTAFQSNSQPLIKQKSEMVRSIFDNTATQIIFRTEDPDTRKQLEEDIGDYEQKRNTKSRSHGKQGTNRTISEAPRRKPLITRHRLKRLKKGQFVLLSAGMDNRPVIHQYRRWWRNRTDMRRLKECKRMYKSRILPVLNRKYEQNMQVQDEQGKVHTFTIEQLQENRADAADWNLPLPTEIEADNLENAQRGLTRE